GEEEGVALDQRFEERLLDAAEHRTAARREADALADIAHLESRDLDDRADVQPVLLGDARMAYAPHALLRPADAGVAVVALQGVAAGRDEIDDAVERRAVQSGIGSGGPDLVEQAGGVKWR